jgi:hypothetical protein
MSDSPTKKALRGGRRYEIWVRSVLSEHFALGFKGIDLQVQDGEITVLVGEIVDQSQLHGLLDSLSNYGLELLSLKAISERGER